MFARSAYSTRSFRRPQNFMPKGASHLVLSGMPSIGTIAASRLDESRYLAFVVARAMRQRGWVVCQFHKAEKLERITALSRTFLRWHFEEVLHCDGPSPRTTRERGQRRRKRTTLHPRRQTVWAYPSRSQIDRAAGQPLATGANPFATHQRSRDALCRCEKPYQEHKSSSKFV